MLRINYIKLVSIIFKGVFYEKNKKKDLIDLLKIATNVMICQNKLIIDINLKRIIINDVLYINYYLNLYNNNMIEPIEPFDKVYCEKNLKLILKYYPDITKRNWLSEVLNLSKGQISDKYSSMLVCFKKNNRYTKDYWEEELEDLKKIIQTYNL